MNAPLKAIRLADHQHLEAQIEADNRIRIGVASRIAAGMCANPHSMEMHNWQGEVAFNSLSVADKLIALVRSA